MSAPESLNDAIVEQSPDAIIFADKEGLIQVWNARAAAIFGFSAEEALGQNLDIIIPERLRAAHWRGFDHAITTGEEKYAGRSMTTRSAHKDGRTIYVDLSFALLKDSTGAIIGALATARDATERYLEEKAMRERLRKAEAGQLNRS